MARACPRDSSGMTVSTLKALTRAAQAFKERNWWAEECDAVRAAQRGRRNVLCVPQSEGQRRHTWRGGLTAQRVR
eukprot:359878-Chlamydomonas_euryale.AAC.1